jgi:hypothetical protein
LSSADHVTRYVKRSAFGFLLRVCFISNSFEFVDGRENLTNLIRLSLAFFLLDVDARVARPRGFEHCMTCAALAWLAEVLHA